MKDFERRIGMNQTKSKLNEINKRVAMELNSNEWNKEIIKSKVK
jgi:hypothetical protein